MTNKKQHSFIAITSFIAILVGSSIILSINIPLNFESFATQDEEVLKTAATIDPIDIGSNSDLATHPNITGAGTWDQPYMIENYELTGSGADKGINITNTDKPLIIKDCSIKSFDDAVWLSEVSNVKVINCSLLNNSGFGINAFLVNNNTYKINNISNNDDGISIMGTSVNNTIQNNTLLNNVDYGIQLENCNNNTVAGNKILDSDYGIKLSGAHYNNLTGNSVSNAEYYGLWIYWADHTNLMDNTAYNNSIGVFIDDSEYAILTYNNATNNNYGIYLDKSNNSLLYENYFISNNENGRDEGTNNDWNQSIGNYWSDYTGEDVDNDGIGDIPYNISGTAGTKDYLPIWDDGPTIIIIEPTPHQAFGSSAPNFTVEISHPELNTMWYSINGGQNIIFTANETVNQTAWDALSNGTYILTFYANDSAGKIASETVSIKKDTADPEIDIISPTPSAVFGPNAPGFEVEISDLSLDTMWYSLNGGQNQTFTSNETLNQAMWNALPNSTITLTFYANDTGGRLSSVCINIEKDAISPSITINSPAASGEFTDAPSFEVIITDSNFEAMWYSLNDGQNYTFSANGTINQAAWSALSSGTVTITFYANDTAGNVASESIDVMKSTVDSGDGGEVPSYPLLIILPLGITTMIGIVFVAKKQTKMNNA